MIVTNGRVATEDIWRESSMSDRKSKDHVAYRIYSKYLTALIRAMEAVLLDGRTIYLPERMGSIRLKKFRPISKIPNWQLTNKLWDIDAEAKENKTLIYHNYDHTLGFRSKLVWRKYNCQFKHKSICTLKSTRGFSRRVSELYKEDSYLIDKIKI